MNRTLGKGSTWSKTLPNSYLSRYITVGFPGDTEIGCRLRLLPRKGKECTLSPAHTHQLSLTRHWKQPKCPQQWAQNNSLETHKMLEVKIRMHLPGIQTFWNIPGNQHIYLPMQYWNLLSTCTKYNRLFHTCKFVKEHLACSRDRRGQAKPRRDTLTSVSLWFIGWASPEEHSSVDEGDDLRCTQCIAGGWEETCEGSCISSAKTTIWEMLLPTGRTHLCLGGHLHEDKPTGSAAPAWHHSVPWHKNRAAKVTGCLGKGNAAPTSSPRTRQQRKESLPFHIYSV